MKNLKAQLLEEIERNQEMMRERAERIARWETDMDDCFVSEKFNGLSIQLAKRKLEILENGGVEEFPCLRDLETDEVVTDTMIRGQYGLVWLIDEAHREKFGRFVGMAQRESTYAKKGLKRSMVTLPAWATTQANGTGMAGAFMSRVVTFKSDVNYATKEEEISS